MCCVADDILLHESFRQQGPDDEDGEEEEEQEAETWKSKRPTRHADVEKTQGYQSWLRRSTPKPQRSRTRSFLER